MAALFDAPFLKRDFKIYMSRKCWAFILQDTQFNSIIFFRDILSMGFVEDTWWPLDDPGPTGVLRLHQTRLHLWFGGGESHWSNFTGCSVEEHLLTGERSTYVLQGLHGDCVHKAGGGDVQDDAVCVRPADPPLFHVALV